MSKLGVVATTAVLALTLSGCSVIEDWLGTGEEEIIEETVTESVTPEEAEATDAAPAQTGLAVPTCEEIYSAELNQALLDQVRVSRGETSEGNFGYGTVNPELVSILKNVRRDLRISCTWYLPASESVSVTSIAIVSGDVESDVTRILSGIGATREDAGGGVIFTIDETTSDISTDFIATEAHFLNEIPCPSSLAETTCAAWVSTNYAFGQASVLTLDAATTLGVLED